MLQVYGQKVIYCLINIDPRGTELWKLSRKINRSIKINTLCTTDPKKMWSEIKKLVSSKAISKPVNCDISSDRFDSHVINITKNLDSN